jgi:hypothetical protein
MPLVCGISLLMNAQTIYSPAAGGSPPARTVGGRRMWTLLFLPARDVIPRAGAGSIHPAT